VALTRMWMLSKDRLLVTAIASVDGLALLLGARGRAQGAGNMVPASYLDSSSLDVVGPFIIVHHDDSSS